MAGLIGSIQRPALFRRTRMVRSDAFRSGQPGRRVCVGVHRDLAGKQASLDLLARAPSLQQAADGRSGMPVLTRDRTALSSAAKPPSYRANSIGLANRGRAVTCICSCQFFFVTNASLIAKVSVLQREHWAHDTLTDARPALWRDLGREKRRIFEMHPPQNSGSA
jgi:hypothetical protein